MHMNTPIRQDVAPGPSLTLEHEGSKAGALLALGVIVAILIAYHETTWSMISTWSRSDTFAHGFLIFPFSAYLIWGQREHLGTLFARPNPKVLFVLAILGFSWLLGTLASVQVFAQFMVIAMISAAVWAILGNQIAWALAFPLAYLLLAVPFGDAFIPSLINFTADFTVTALQLTGIPVYREGNFFTIPSGNWSVVEACSGLRYLIASFTLGTLYAYLTYRSLTRRLIFIALSLIVPILANGIRAYLIVMTGHLSGMQLAVGIDHLIYGWIFFGFVMLMLFWVGSFWREDENKLDSISRTRGVSTGNNRGSEGDSTLRTTITAGAVLSIAVIWPIYAEWLERKVSYGTEEVEIHVLDASGKWQASPELLSDWKPIYTGSTAQFLRNYRNNGRSVDLYISYYREQKQGIELINSENVLVPEKGSKWHDAGEDMRTISLGSQEEIVKQNRLHSPSISLLAWRWYWIGGEETANPYWAKLMLARNKLLGRGDDAVEIIVATRYEDSVDEAASVLQDFITDTAPAITGALRNAANR
ncbi:exosortase A [Nitrosospira multiformis]|uniref:Exosortase A n=2 Tax=Nitrosospira multiformis TaxID=1231 RepID=A0A2T5IG89_9PROT|nr:exosortase A [Nitrosospira multiformis]